MTACAPPSLPSMASRQQLRAHCVAVRCVGEHLEGGVRPATPGARERRRVGPEAGPASAGLQLCSRRHARADLHRLSRPKSFRAGVVYVDFEVYVNFFNRIPGEEVAAFRRCIPSHHEGAS